MSEQRLIDIEMRLAYQDQALHELNEVVTRQQASLTTLEGLCAALAERLAAVHDAVQQADHAGRVQDERPPHY